MTDNDQIMNFIRDQFEQVNHRLDEYNAIFQKHLEDDKLLAEHINNVDKEVTFAKGVTYAVNAMSAAVAWLFGWSKQ